jgi:hypothetical protein
MTEARRRKPFAVLQRLAQLATPAVEPMQERCDLCSEPIPPDGAYYEYHAVERSRPLHGPQAHVRLDARCVPGHLFFFAPNEVEPLMEDGQ